MEEVIDSTILKLTPTFREKTYSVLREERHFFNNISSANFMECNIKVVYVKTFPNNINRFKVCQSNFKQSNATGIYRWAGEMHSLREEVIMDIGPNGHIVNILNHNIIKILWHELKHDLKKKFKKDPYTRTMIKNIGHLMDSKETYTKLLEYSYPYIYLFPHIYNKEMDKENGTPGYRELNTFIGSRKVPILTNEKLLEAKDENQTEVIVQGEIDKQNFKQDQISQMIKTLKNRPRARTQVSLNYTERYRLDADGSPTQAMCLAMLKVPGTLVREERTIIKQLDIR